MEGSVESINNIPTEAPEAITPIQPEQEKSPYVAECIGMIEGAKKELISGIENYQIDAELKIRLVDLVNKHMNSINFSDYSNASAVGIYVLGNKILESIRDFKFEMIGTSGSYRYLGTEESVVGEVVNPLMMNLGAKINECEIKRNLNSKPST